MIDDCLSENRFLMMIKLYKALEATVDDESPPKFENNLKQRCGVSAEPVSSSNSFHAYLKPAPLD